ncbi:MAG: polyprenyl synthetase [Bacteroidetes bacterium]|jgi:octaprenyl-diphosphate synthase|nr:polyprenyl synthetase [Bacteroidota bacterium]MBP1678567.1 polyprenyl synthetase [Bacteroidota bacterium]
MREPGSVAELKDITRPVHHHLERFEGVFREAMRSRVPLVDLVTRYIMRQKGKRVRPLLVMLTAEACGGVNERTFRGATLVEILHTATLVHDDVVDDADTRRGLASINAVWKNKIAVLMGDYLLARGLLLSLENNDVGFLRITSTSVRRMSEGEIHQIQRSRKLNIDEESYLRIIGDKTASLLSTCCEIGATSATDDAEKGRRMREYGENVGMAFQIRDDLLDYIGRTSITGKPVGLDVSERKLTLPLIYALRRASPGDRSDMLGMIRKGGKKMDMRRVLEFVRAHGGLEYAADRARAYAARATECLATFPPSPARESLESFAQFVVERNR